MPLPPTAFVPPFAPWTQAGTSTTFDDAQQTMEDFANARDWRQFHTPRNLLLALTGEVGEVAELFQWRSEEDCANGLQGFTEAQKEAVADELADVLAYLTRLSAACGIDLAAAWRRKMAKNAAKYPAEAAKGSSAKYTELRDKATLEQNGKNSAGKRKPKAATPRDSGNATLDENTVHYSNNSSLLDTLLTMNPPNGGVTNRKSSTSDNL
jgi:dCTP diphosphatase